MKAELLAGLGPVEKQERETILRGCAPGFQIIKEVLEKRLKEKTARLLDRNYEVTNWAQLQADQIGEIRALKELIELLTLDREKT